MAELIAWQSHLNLGVEPLDRQHRVLAGQLNHLAAALEDPSTTAAARLALLEDIYQHARGHFLDEERLMLASGFRGSTQHQREHAMLLGELKSLTTEIASGRAPLNADLLHSLRHWLIAHIVTSDRQFATEYRQSNHHADTEAD